jgi:SAM-dependent methyltransferase
MKNFKRIKFRVESVYSMLQKKWLLSTLKSLPNFEIVLDLGSSISPYRKYIKANKFITVDIDPDKNPTIVADIHSLPFADEIADLVILTEVLEHCYSPSQVIQEVYRVLKPGGICIATVPFLYKFHPDPRDYYRFTEQGIKFLFKEFREVKIYSYGNRFQVMYELLYQGVMRYPIFFLNYLIYLLNWKDKTSPLGYGVFAIK